MAGHDKMPVMTAQADPVRLKHRHLEQIAMTALRAARLLRVDWPAFGPVLLAGAAGRYVRHLLRSRDF